MDMKRRSTITWVVIGAAVLGVLLLASRSTAAAEQRGLQFAALVLVVAGIVLDARFVWSPGATGKTPKRDVAASKRSRIVLAAVLLVLIVIGIAGVQPQGSSVFSGTWLAITLVVLLLLVSIPGYLLGRSASGAALVEVDGKGQVLERLGTARFNVEKQHGKKVTTCILPPKAPLSGNPGKRFAIEVPESDPELPARVFYRGELLYKGPLTERIDLARFSK